MANEQTRGKQQSELLALQRRLARAERLSALGALTARIAHELGTPLHSIAGHLDLLATSRELSPGDRERVEIIAGEVTRLESLIRAHLRRLRSPHPSPEATNVNAIVERIMQLMTPVFETRRIESRLELDAGAGHPVPCDPGQVEQVLMNLIQNALDAMPVGGRLALSTRLTESGIAISIGDDGRGIEPDHLEQVYEPFFTTKAPGAGTGLGLFLSREIARMHGGDIVIDSKPGLGTVVTMTMGLDGAS